MLNGYLGDILDRSLSYIDSEDFIHYDIFCLQITPTKRLKQKKRGEFSYLISIANKKKNGGRIGTIQAIFLPCKVLSSMQTSGFQQ